MFEILGNKLFKLYLRGKILVKLGFEKCIFNKNLLGVILLVIIFFDWNICLVDLKIYFWKMLFMLKNIVMLIFSFFIVVLK